MRQMTLRMREDLWDRLNNRVGMVSREKWVRELVLRELVNPVHMIGQSRRSTMSRTVKGSVSVREQHKAAVVKRLRKRDAKDINQLADELGLTRQALAVPLAQLVREDAAKRSEVHERGRPTRVVYTKP